MNDHGHLIWLSLIILVPTVGASCSCRHSAPMFMRVLAINLSFIVDNLSLFQSLMCIYDTPFSINLQRLVIRLLRLIPLMISDRGRRHHVHLIIKSLICLKGCCLLLLILEHLHLLIMIEATLIEIVIVLP
jgi:hypothetical protein